MNEQMIATALFDDIYTALLAYGKKLIENHEPGNGLKTAWTTMGLSIVAEREPNRHGVPDDAISVSYRIWEPRYDGWYLDVRAVWWDRELFRPNTHVDIVGYGVDGEFPDQTADEIARMALRYLLTR